MLRVALTNLPRRTFVEVEIRELFVLFYTFANMEDARTTRHLPFVVFSLGIGGMFESYPLFEEMLSRLPETSLDERLQRILLFEGIEGFPL